MSWEIVAKILNLICSGLTIGFGTYAASQSVEGAIVAGLGGVVNHLRSNPIASVPATPSIQPNVLKSFVLLTFLILAFPIMGKADTTLEWDRNTESDLSHYNAYYCLTKGCIVNLQSTRSGDIPQTALGIKPTFSLPTGEGSIAVSASDQNKNESGLSVQIPFDRLAPHSPTNVHLK